MFYQFFDVESLVHVLSKLNPDCDVVIGRRVHGRIIEEYFTQLHEFIDLLNKETITMVWLLLSSSLRQMCVMYSTYCILFL